MSCRIIAVAVFGLVTTLTPAQSWKCYGGNPQHSGVFTGYSQSANTILWQTPLDDNRDYYGVGSDVLIHFAAPMVTASNTVVHALRYTTSGPNYDNWRMYGRSGATGATVWSYNSDYSAAIVWPADWTSVYPATLFQTNSSGTSQGVAFAGADGSIFVRTSADASSSSIQRYVFYTSLSDFNANKTAYAPVKICTPLTADKQGNIYFGYEVTGSIPSSISALGTGGIAKVNALTGAATYLSTSQLGISASVSRPAINAAPALSNDSTAVYFALTGNDRVLVKCSTGTLNVLKSAILYDPAVSGAEAGLINESSASPMVGPDGHVFMGVFGYQWRESHGWMLQFDADLSQKDSSGNTFPVGAFGWDDTAVVVPANIVPSYKGSASYLILTKYNNYDDNGSDSGADGSNKVAVLDPTSNSKSKDRQSGIAVMNEILTVLGPTKTNSDPNHPNAVNEWCINSAAIDVNGKAAIINSEDGHMYRWSFVTNTLSESLNLQPATGEAYTETAIGPDGTLYAINNAILFAVGSNPATAISTYTGTYLAGGLSDILYIDGNDYKIRATSIASGMVAAAIVDFSTTATSPTAISVSSALSASTNVSGIVTGQIFLYNFTTGGWTSVSSTSLGASQVTLGGSITKNVSNYISSTGQMRVMVRSVGPQRFGSPAYMLWIDQVSCGAH